MSLVRKLAISEKKIAAHPQNGGLSPGPRTAKGKARRRDGHPGFAKSVEVSYYVIAQIDMSIRPILALATDSANVELGTTRPTRDVATYQCLREFHRGIALEKNVIKYERSHYVYENARKSDTMSDGKSGIFGDMTCFLQREAAYDTQFEAI